jgi:biopolymer transport protein ExbB
MNWLSRKNIRVAVYLGAVALLPVVGSPSSHVGAQTADDAHVPATNAAAAADDAKAEEAADGDNDREKGEGEKKDADDKSLGKMIFVKSGLFGAVFYLVLFIFSIVALGVSLERIFNLSRRKIMPLAFTSRLLQMIRAKDDNLDNLRTLCDATPSPIASILRAGIIRAGRPLPEVEKSMEDAASREMAALRGRNTPLNVIGEVAPLVGLLGTVVGMIFAFRMSSQEGLGKAEVLAEGIYLALMTTAAGLTIAIPCLLLVAWFNAIVNRYMRDIDECLLETMPCFTRLENSNGGKPIEPATSSNAKA